MLEETGSLDDLVSFLLRMKELAAETFPLSVLVLLFIASILIYFKRTLRW
jgi:hypothetical protein